MHKMYFKQLSLDGMNHTLDVKDGSVNSQSGKGLESLAILVVIYSYWTDF